MQFHIDSVAASTSLTIKNISQATLLFGEDDSGKNTWKQSEASRLLQLAKDSS
jgi:tagatose-1,6-bisphosphate aldolase non-catalytic subunit AgaZ/GatZ